jgi:hypothetical protein
VVLLLMLAANYALMLPLVRFVSGLLLLVFDEFWLLVAFNAELLLSMLHDASLIQIVAFYSWATFFVGLYAALLLLVSFLCFSCFAIGGA